MATRRRVDPFAPKSKPKSAPKPTHDETQQAAWKAVKEFNKLLPTLSAFAQTMIGNSRVTVQATKGTSCTDGTKILIHPPIELGLHSVHDTHVCYKRTASGEQECAACSAREMVLWVLYHEVAHISEKSTDRPTMDEVATVISLIKEWHPVGACDHAEALMIKARRAVDTLNLVGVHNRYLPAIIKPLEDVRVDTRIPILRPGLRIVQQVRVKKIMNEGIKLANGTSAFWRDAPVGAQVMCGLMLIGLQMEIEDDWLAPEALDYLNDREVGGLVDIAHASRDADSVHDVFNLTIQLWYRAQELGLFTVPKCKVPDPEPEPEGNDGEPPEKDGEPDSDGDSGDSGEAGEPGDQGDAESPSGKDQSDDGEGGEGSEGGDGGAGSSDGVDGSSDFEEDEPSSDRVDNEGETSDTPADPSELSDESSNDDTDSDDSGEAPEWDGSLGDNADNSTGEPEESSRKGDTERVVSKSVGSGSTESVDETTPDDTDDSGSPEEDDLSDRGSSAEDKDSGDDSDFDGTSDAAESESDSTDGDEVSDEGTPPTPKGESVWDRPEEVAKTPEEIEAEVAELLDLMNQFDSGSNESELLDPLDEGKNNVQINKEDAAISLALSQSEVFDTTSRGTRGLQIIQYPHRPFQWMPNRSVSPSDFEPSQSVLGPALMHGRVTFSANRMTRDQINLKYGRINGSSLGKRAALGDPRLFSKRQLPEKRDYFVMITVDVSGSTDVGDRLEKIKRSVFGQANLMAFLGVKFAIYAHSGGADANNIYNYTAGQNSEVWMLEVKKPTDPWNQEAKQRLADLQPIAGNYDGHTLEFCRKVVDGRRETDRIIIYYTDGDMPTENPTEELAILKREIKTCRDKRYVLLAVAIGTSSPVRHGFDTVRVDSDEDIIKVIKHLEKKLTS